jgi:IPTL-CTERM motif/Calx-beta domain
MKSLSMNSFSNAGLALLGAMLLAASPASYAVPSLKVVAGTVCTSSTTTLQILPGATGVFSVCAQNDNASPNDFVCNATYPLLAADAAAIAAGVQVVSPINRTSPFTEDLANTALPATLVASAIGFSNGVVTNAAAAGQSSAAFQKIAELTFSVPAPVAAGTTLTFGLGNSRGIGIRNSVATNCNDLDNTQAFVSVADAPFTITTGAVASPQVSVAATTQASETGPTNGVLTFTRTGATTAAQVLTSAITGTAVNPADYAFTAGTCTAVSGTATLTLTIPIGSASCTVNVVPVDDAVVDPAETVIAAVPAGAGVTGTGTPATITIADNDVAPTVAVTATTQASETGPVNGVFTFTRTGSTAAAQVITSAITGTAANPADYAFTAGTCTAVSGTATLTLTIPAASASCTVNVVPVDDAVTDAAETVIAAVPAGAGVTGTGASATVTITDNDGPQTVTVSGVSAPASENGGVLTYTFTRTGNAGQIAVALNGVVVTPPAVNARYTTTCAATINFLAAATTATCTVTGVDNAVVDGNINVVVALGAAAAGYTVGSPASQTGILQDNEVGVSVAASAGTITEGGLATFTLSCTGTGTFLIPFTVNTTGTDGAPTPASPQSLTCGTPLNITVQTAQNTTPADSRTLTLTLGALPAGAAPVPGQGSASVNVQDDDGAPVMVPTLGTFGIGLMALLIAGFGALTQRRRKQ